MKVLVTGGVGFVGTNLIKRLLKDGHKVVSIDNYSAGKKENHQDGCLYYDYDLSYNYVRDDGDRYDVIFHMAALARIQPSLKHPHKTIYNNFTSTLNILEYAREKTTPVVFAGSSSYHHGLWGSPYAWSKFGGEQLCELYNKVYNLPITICRFYNVYGPHQIEEGTYATVIGIFQKQYREGNPLTIVGDGEQKRDFTHIDDIVDGLVKCGNCLLDEIDYPNIGDSLISGKIFELGRGKNYSINEIVDMFGKDCPRINLPSRLGEYDVTLADYSLAKDTLGWSPKGELEKYIKSIVGK